jgi:hypothetical protein
MRPNVRLAYFALRLGIYVTAPNGSFTFQIWNRSLATPVMENDGMKCAYPQERDAKFIAIRDHLRHRDLEVS